MNIDFGTAFHKPNGNAVKVTINEFRETLLSTHQRIFYGWRYWSMVSY